MVLIFVNLLLWIPSVLGYGLGLVVVRKRLGEAENVGTVEIFESLFGMFVLTVIINILNFFSEINDGIALILLLVGWGCLWLRYQYVSPIRISKQTFVFLFLWLVFVSFWAAQPPRNLDSGLYHVQAIRWINESALPLGLANLHHRIGFNSSWFSLAALVKLPIHGTEEVTCFSISALIVYFFGIAVATAFRAFWFERSRMVHDLFLSLAVFVFLGNVTRRNISSPSPDIAVLILCVLLVALALRTLETRTDWTYRSFQILLIAFFAVTIKLSSVPLLLFPFGLMIFAALNKIPLRWKSLAGYVSIPLTIGTGAWLARGIALSGCFGFPIAQTCLGNFSWTIPRSTAINEWLADKATPRIRSEADHEMILSNWDWVGPWFDGEILSSVDFVLSMILLGAGIIFLVMSKVFLKQGTNLSLHLSWLLVPLIIAIGLWFFSAPDIRFAAGYFWALGLLVLSFGLSTQSNFTSQKNSMIALSLVALALLIPLKNQLYSGLPPVRKAARDVRTFLFDLPMPGHKTKTQYSLEGIPIYVPEDLLCWSSELPCMPYFNQNIRVRKGSDGDFLMFYFPRTEESSSRKSR